MNSDSLDRDIADFFVAGGTLLPDSPSYVKRAADDELFTRALAGEFCYILTARQMGKSSLMIRTARRLQAEGVKTVIIDLTQIGTVSIDQWYLGLLSEIKRRLQLSVDPVNWWQERSMLGHVQRLTDFLRDVVLAEISGNVAIFIDEIDTTLKLDFRDDFFTAIRAMYNARAETPEFARLTFVLLGVASPSDLIKDRGRTPFNIGQEIPLRRFNRGDARVLEQGLEQVYPRQGAAIFSRIFYWTKGHPYLTQKLCQAIVEKAYQQCDDKQVDALVKSLFLSEEARRETNLQFVRDNILTHPHRRDLLRLYSTIYKGKIVQDNKQSIVQNQLKLSGLVVVEDGKLCVHNEIYRQVFSLAWVRRNTAINWAPILAGVATTVAVLAVGAIVYNWWVGIQIQGAIANFYQARSPQERIAHLAKLFASQGLFGSADYDYKAREMFYGLSRDEQLALFDAENGATPELLGVIVGLYTTLADTDGSDNTGPLLQAMLEALEELNPKPEIDRLKTEIADWLRGRELAKQGQYDQALIKFDQAIALNPENPATLYERARMLINLSRYNDALANLDQVVGIARKSPAPTSTPTPVQKTATLSPLTKTPPATRPAGTPTATKTVLATTTIDLTSGTQIMPTATSLIVTETSTPAPTPLPETINPEFATIGEIVAAVRNLIRDNSELTNFLVNANASQYPSLEEFGLVPRPTATPSKVLIEPSNSAEISGTLMLLVPTLKTPVTSSSSPTAFFFPTATPSELPFLTISPPPPITPTSLVPSITPALSPTSTLLAITTQPPPPTLTPLVLSTTSSPFSTNTLQPVTSSPPPATTKSTVSPLSVTVFAQCTGDTRIRVIVEASGGKAPYIYIPAQNFITGSGSAIDVQVNSVDGQSWVARIPLPTCP